MKPIFCVIVALLVVDDHIFALNVEGVFHGKLCWLHHHDMYTCISNFYIFFSIPNTFKSMKVTTLLDSTEEHKIRKKRNLGDHFLIHNSAKYTRKQ